MEEPPVFFKYFQINGYDAMWALALALNRTEAILKTNGSTLSDFHYNNTVIRSILFNEMTNTDFIGISVSSILDYPRLKLFNHSKINLQTIEGLSMLAMKFIMNL